MDKVIISIFTFTLLFFTSFQSFGKVDDQAVVARYQIYKPMFGKAYAKYPEVPRGVLEAVSYSYTRFYHLEETQEHSCVGVPQALTIMGLTDDGKNYFRSNLSLVEKLSGLDKSQILSSPGIAIEAYAAAYAKLLVEKNITSSSIEDQVNVLIELFELPQTQNVEQDFAMSANLYAILYFLQDPANQIKYNIPNRMIDMEAVFGRNNLEILSSKKVNISDSGITNEAGVFYKSQNKAACLDYPLAIWNQADTSNFSSRNGTAISAFTIHDIQGSYAAAIAWFKNPVSNVSTHYVIRAFDGQVTQMVCEVDKAWHVTSSNPFTVGTEHEGYWDVPGWYTEAMYQASAAVVGNTLDNHGLDRRRAYDGPSISGLQTLSSCYNVKGHQHFPNQSHTDPGVYWDWAYFYELLNSSYTISNTYATATGTFYDDGGAAGNYAANNRTFWLIQPTGASSVTLNFTQFATEYNYDFLYIYDGTTVNDPLIGKYSGTSSPGTAIGTSGSLLIEFRSDCSLMDIGWEANWTSDLTPQTCGTPTNLTVSNVTPFTADLNWNAVSGADSYAIRYRHRMNDTLWTYANSLSNNYTINGLAANGQHDVHIAAICGQDTSAYIGNDFGTLPAQGHVTTTVCSGTFRDAGGNVPYNNSENYLFTIAPTGVTNVSVVFESFDAELNYDYLYAYNGLDATAPSLGVFNGTTNPGTVTSTNGGLTFKFYSDGSTVKQGWEAKWYAYGGTCPANPVTQVTAPNNWETTNYTANYTDTDNSNTGIKERFYQVIDFNGTTWEANNNNGFLFDDFTTGMNPDWVSHSGNWSVVNGALVQSDEANINTNLYIPIEQDSTHSYLYTWRMKIEGTSTSKRAGVHIFSDVPTGVERGDSYLAWIRWDAGTIQLWDNVNNVDALATDEVYATGLATWADYKYLYNPQTGEQSLYINDVLVSTYVDATPHKTGQYLSLRTRYCTGSFDDIKVYKSRGTSSLINVGPAVTNDIHYQNQNPTTPSGSVRSIVIDNNQHISTENVQNQNIDWTNPDNLTSINDGLSADIDTTYSGIDANWAVSADTHSAIKSYWYAIGTTPGATDVVSWTDNGTATSMSIPNTGQFVVNQVYYVSVKAENNAGLFSNTITSDGQILLQLITVQASFTADFTNVCEGSTVNFTNTSTDAIAYNWTFSGADVSSSTNTNPSVTFITPGMQTATLVASDSINTDTISMLITVNANPAQPTVTTGGNGGTCGADSVELSTGSYNNYTWSNGATTQTIWVTTSGSYVVQVNDANGCSSQSDTVEINLAAITAPQICIVSADSTGNYTQIVWEKPVNAGIDSFYVYRENTIAGQFDFLAAIDYNDFSVFVDADANPAQQAYRYKMSALDTCGGETLLSDFHKTIHLTINQGVGQTWNLLWNHYEGFSYGTYNIYRGTDPNNLSFLASVASSLDSFTDLAPPTGMLYYQIEIVNSFGCSPAKANYASSRSNIVANSASSIESNNGIQHITMYPNPTSGITNILVSSEGFENEVTVNVYNVIGEVLLSRSDVLNRQSTIISLDLTYFAKGQYFIELAGEKNRWIEKVVKE